ncbi:hypothetical protein NE237_022724 [Protea cynaroides]|uniref:Uncharacterized protein n=1 Tax=Protea cynaroides TaxID=273540 RepID=A0A9Q0HDR2_9MAGN|nr:hypothetical protein NE237_022724 [Protea cynaroides]
MILSYEILSCEGRELKAEKKCKTICSESSSNSNLSSKNGSHEEDDFRPTTPSHSPGVGHSFTLAAGPNKHGVERESSDAMQYEAGNSGFVREQIAGSAGVVQTAIAIDEIPSMITARGI